MKPNILETINNPTTRLKIATYNGKTEQSVILWIKKNHKNLTLPESIRAIEETTSLKRKDIIS